MEIAQHAFLQARGVRDAVRPRVEVNRRSQVRDTVRQSTGQLTSEDGNHGLSLFSLPSDHLARWEADSALSEKYDLQEELTLRCDCNA